MGRFRDGMPVTADAVTLILSTLDRVKSILDGIETLEHEPEGDDSDLIGRLGAMARGEQVPRAEQMPPPAATPAREATPSPDDEDINRRRRTPLKSVRKPRKKPPARPPTSLPTIRSASASTRSII